MEIFRFNILPLEEVERRQAFKEAVNNCPHCGQILQFQVQIDLETNLLQEDCHCNACAAMIRSELHSIQ